MWRRQNSFHGERPLIYLRAFAFDEFFDTSVLKCTDPMLRGYEKQLHEALYRSALGDDYIVEPWLSMNASYKLVNDERWGVRVGLGEAPQQGALRHLSLF